MHHLAVAGLLAALAAAHGTVAAHCLFLFARVRVPWNVSAGGKRERPKLSRAERELWAFGLLNIALVALGGGFARAVFLLDAPQAPDPAVLAPALMAAEAGRLGALVFLVRFLLDYLGIERRRWTLPVLYTAGAALEVGNAAGLFHRYDSVHVDTPIVLGVALPNVCADPTPLGVVVSFLGAACAAGAVVILGRAVLRGRREAASVIGVAILAAACLHDALRNAELVSGPVLSPLGYAAFVNGVLLTLLGRFTVLRASLEAKAAELRTRAKGLARSYDELQAKQDELVRKEQLAAVGELSAVVAHEVRNPLAIIGNAVATLRRSTLAAEDRETLLQILEEESSRLNRLVGDLLRYARPIAIERQTLSVRELVDKSLALGKTRLDISIEILEPTPVDRIAGDPGLLRQVVDNLIDNAMQAMSEGGLLTVRILEIEQEGTAGVELQIQDTGEGMDTMVRSRALDPFFTTRPSGTGLGLAIVNRIVDAHGGTLRIKSAAGDGTVMHVFLPRVRESGAPPIASTRRPTEPSMPEGSLPVSLQASLGHRRDD